jgi:hypothetical protein
MMYPEEIYHERIKVLEAENERLREALLKIADGEMPEFRPDGSRWWFDGGEGFYEWALPFARAALGDEQ